MKITPIGTYKVHPKEEDFEYAMSVHHDREFVEKEASTGSEDFHFKEAFVDYWK